MSSSNTNIHGLKFIYKTRRSESHNLRLVFKTMITRLYYKVNDMYECHKWRNIMLAKLLIYKLCPRNEPRH